MLFQFQFLVVTYSTSVGFDGILKVLLHTVIHNLCLRQISRSQTALKLIFFKAMTFHLI